MRLIETVPADDVAAALRDCLNTDNPDLVYLCANPEAVLDVAIPLRIEQGLGNLERFGARWFLAAAAGYMPDSQFVSSLYAKYSPSLSVQQAVRPLILAQSDAILMPADAVRRTLHVVDRVGALAPFEQLAVLAGYASGSVSLFAPFLAIGIDGSALPRQAMAGAETGQIYASVVEALGLGPQQALGARVDQVMAAHCDPLSLSVVTRTQLRRPHLLRRALASIAAARGARSVEVILASDADRGDLQETARNLQAEFSTLALRPVHSALSDRPSRVANLLAGFKAATHDYVMTVDDDDYLDDQALNRLSPVTFLGARPMVFATHTVHDELWTEEEGGQPRLMQSKLRRTLPASGWKFLFNGFNQISTCGAAIPRGFLKAFLTDLPLNYDLSEDYALFLFLLSHRDLPEIVEVAETVVHQSTRVDGGNSVTAADRSGWTHDIAGHLYDVTRSPGGASAGQWQLRVAQAQVARAARQAAQAETEALRRKVAELDGVIESMTTHIRDLVEQVQTTPAQAERIAS
jgi:hypothetical protein